MKFIQLFIPLTIIFFFSLQCTKDKAPESSENDSCDTVATASYQNHIEPIISTNCNISNCHADNTGGVNFSDYSTVKDYVNNGLIEQRVLIDKNMPPSSPLPKCDRQLLQQWIDAGAPNN